MSIENDTPVEPVEDDLDAFSDTFFGRKVKEPEAATPEADDQTDDTSDAPEDTQVEDDTLAEDDSQDDSDDSDDDTSDDTKPEPKKKNRFQERIDELNGKYREEERQRKALELRLQEIEANQPKQDVKPTPSAIDADDAPQPTDQNEDGTDKYPLGEFDPAYIKDLMRHTLDTEARQRRADEEKAATERALQAQQAELQKTWQEKLEPAQERYPDFQEKGQELIDSFSDLDPSYGEYLSATLMSMEFGPDVLYYLSNNPDEARRIVNSGPTKATIALGRIESKFAEAEAEKQTKRPKVSSAPNPPSRVNKGTALVLPDVPDDTDDLDAFEDKFFAKKRRR